MRSSKKVIFEAASVAMNILIHWIKNGKRQAPDELADALEGLAKKMITLDQLL